MKNISNLFVRLFVISLLTFRYFSVIVSLFVAGAATLFTAPAPRKPFRRLRFRLRPKCVGSGSSGSGSGSASLIETEQRGVQSKIGILFDLSRFLPDLQPQSQDIPYNKHPPPPLLLSRDSPNERERSGSRQRHSPTASSVQCILRHPQTVTTAPLSSTPRPRPRAAPHLHLARSTAAPPERGITFHPSATPRHRYRRPRRHGTEQGWGRGRGRGGEERGDTWTPCDTNGGRRRRIHLTMGRRNDQAEILRRPPAIYDAFFVWFSPGRWLSAAVAGVKFDKCRGFAADRRVLCSWFPWKGNGLLVVQKEKE